MKLRLRLRSKYPPEYDICGSAMALVVAIMYHSAPRLDLFLAEFN